MASTVDAATELIEVLQHENRTLLEDNHKLTSKIKCLENELTNKERIIKIMETKLRVGNSTGSSNRQQDIKMKHLELQIQELMKKNNDLEFEIDSVKFEMCANCERKVVKDSLSYNACSKNLGAKLPTKKDIGDKMPQIQNSSQFKKMERIIEHKDKRIASLSKEVQKLTEIEKELTQKVARMSKLLPAAHLPSETLTECLLKEIQLLESQIQTYKDWWDKLQGPSNILDICYNFTPAKSSEQKILSRNLKENTDSMFNQLDDDLEIVKKENKTLQSCLQKLYNDISELKISLTIENEKMHKGIHGIVLKTDVLENHWQEIVFRLNDIIDYIEHIKHSNIENITEKQDVMKLEDENIISRLQGRLYESLEITTEYKTENEVLKGEIENLKLQLEKEEENHKLTLIQLNRFLTERKTGTNVRKTISADWDEKEKLKEELDTKQLQLVASECHVKSCEHTIKELQTQIKQCGLSAATSPSDLIKNNNVPSRESHVEKIENKLAVAEKNINCCLEFIENLKASNAELESENNLLKANLCTLQKEKSLLEIKGNQNASEESYFSENEIRILKAKVKEQQDKIESLESKNKDLKEDSEKTKMAKAEANRKDVVLLQHELSVANKNIAERDKSIEELRIKIATLLEEKEEMQGALEVEKCKNAMFESQDEEMKLLNENLATKEEENENLKASLIALENKALEMSHYRKRLHIEVDNLCKALNENADDNPNRKAIYKATILHSAQALLRLDEDYNLQSDTMEELNAFNEMQHQAQVYLTEVARIHELLTIKEQQRDQLLNEFLNPNNEMPALNSEHGVNFLESHEEKTQSSQEINASSNIKYFVTHAPESSRSSRKSTNVEIVELRNKIKKLEEDISGAKALAAYMTSVCTKHEDELAKERINRGKVEQEIEQLKENIEELKIQLNSKNGIVKRLKVSIDSMRTKDCDNEFVRDQLNAEINKLREENNKIFDKLSSAEADLSKYKHKNTQMQYDLDSVKKQLINEKYEHTKLINEFKHMRQKLDEPLTPIANYI